MDITGRRKRHTLITPISSIILAILLLIIGVIAGIQIQKQRTTTARSASALATTTRSRTGTTAATTGGFGGFGAGGRTGAGGAAAGATIGTVSSIAHNTLYVTNTSGNIVKVVVPKGLSVSKTETTSLSSIYPGDTVIVTGSDASSGTVTAMSLRDSGKGAVTP